MRVVSFIGKYNSFLYVIFIAMHLCIVFVALIRQALATGKGLRLDGRTALDYRDVRIEITRHENTTLASIQCASTYVICGLHGEVVTPSKDRPSEGIISFACDMSFMAERSGNVSSTTDTDICRMLERSIKESDAIDLESLCVSVGEKVWQLKCSINVVDSSGGNLLDMSCLAAMATLRAFRKSEVVCSTRTAVLPSAAVAPSSGADSAANSAVRVQQLRVFTSDEREPLPLALHHTPLTVTFALFADIPTDSGGAAAATGTGAGTATVLVADPTAAEARVMSGIISYSINAHRELCGVHKPGSCPLSQELVIKGAQLATTRALQLHQLLSSALQDLEGSDAEAKRVRLEALRQSAARRGWQDETNGAAPASSAEDGTSGSSEGGNVIRAGRAAGQPALAPVQRNDPILAWGNLHQSVESVSVNDAKAKTGGAKK